MPTVSNDDEHNPITAVFWGRFPTEIGHAQGHCPTVALFENEAGEYFAVEETRTAPRGAIPVTGDITGNPQIVPDVREWLDERVKFLVSRLS